MSEKKKIQVAWLSGSYFRRRAMMKQIREKFKDSVCFTCDGSISFEYLISHMQSTGCFDESKMVIVNAMPFYKDSNKAKYLKILKEVLSNLDESIFVVFNGLSTTSEKALFAHIKEIGKVYEYPEVIDKKEAPRWVCDQMNKRGFSMDYQVAEALIETCGYDRSLNGVGVDLIEMSMEKIVRYIGEDDKKITLEVVEANIFSHENFIIWDILNAIDTREYGKCVRILSKLHLIDDNVIQAITQIMNTLLWRFRLLLMLKDSMAVAKDQNKAIQNALSLRKLKRTSEGTGFSAEYECEVYTTGENAGKPQTTWTKNVIEGAMNGFYGRDPAINLYTRRDIYRIIRAIQHAAVHLRGLESESRAYLLADIVFMTACNVSDDQQMKIIMDSYEKILHEK